jgi:tetratricopeptide (TPR) repeat protein
MPPAIYSWAAVLFLASAISLTRVAGSGSALGLPHNYNPQAETALSMLQRSQKLIALGRLRDARDELLRGAEAYPREAAFYNFLGIVDAEENHGGAAEVDFRKAIRESPHYAGAYLNLAHLYEVESLRNPEARSGAVRTYRTLLKFDPGNVEANYQCSLLEMQRGAFNASLRYLFHLPANDRRRPRALAVLCADQAGMGKADAATEDARRLASAPGLTEADVLAVIPVLTAHRENTLAIALLKNLEQRHLAQGQTLEQLGILFAGSGQLHQARASLDAAARENPNSIQPLIELARVANRQHDYRGALGYLAHARDLAPGDAAIHFFFGMVCVELDLHQEAYTSLKKAVQLDRDNPYYNFALGSVCTERQDAAEAIGYFKRYCELKPRDPRGLLALAAAYYYGHNLKAAKALLVKTTVDPATSAAADYYLGRIANDSGNWAEAIEDLQRAVKQQPGFADAYAVLGSAYLNQREYAGAQEALNHALKLEPDNYLANLNLMVLYGRTKNSLARAQARRFAEVRSQREQRARWFLRTIRIVP